MKIRKLATFGAAVVALWPVPAAWASDPLDVWTTANAGTQVTLKAVAYGNNRFVAVGDSGTILTSPDGARWTPSASGISNSLFAIVYGAGRFVAVGWPPDLTNGAVAVALTSADGTTWVTRDVPGATRLSSITYAAGYYVAGGYSDVGGLMLYSSDGANWTAAAASTNVAMFNAVCYGNGLFVATSAEVGVGTSYGSAISSNGVTWTFLPHWGPQGAGQIAFGNGVFVAAGGYTTYYDHMLTNHAVVYSCTDGMSWVGRQDTPGEYDAITFDGHFFVATGLNTTSTSPDGTNWTKRAVSFEALGIAYGNAQFLTVGPNGAISRSGPIVRLGAAISPGGQFLGTISGANGLGYSIESSTNLVDWMGLTNLTLTEGTAQFNDPTANMLNRRFYKVLIINQ